MPWSRDLTGGEICQFETKCQILPKSFLLIGSRRTKSEIDEQEKLREDIKRSEQKRRDKEKREAERLKFTEKTYSNLNKKSDVHQVRFIYIYFYILLCYF